MTPRQAVPEPEDGRSGVGDLGGDALRRLLDAVPAGGTVLEVGSGPGWDADFLEARGVTVRRTDITAACIDLQTARGKVVEHLDVTSDDLGGPYAAVLALAVLQHVDRALVPDLLGRVARALTPGGAFLVSVREGDGEQWEVGDSGNPYFTVLWREPDLCDALEDAGFGLEFRAWGEDSEECRWLTFLARVSPEI